MWRYPKTVRGEERRKISEHRRASANHRAVHGMAFPFNKARYLPAKLTVAPVNHRKTKERRMQLLLMIELALMLLFVVKVRIHSIEQELRSKRFRYDDAN
jgi:hypothetical protein